MFLVFPHTTSLQQQALLCTIADGVVTLETPDAVSLVVRHSTILNALKDSDNFMYYLL